MSGLDAWLLEDEEGPKVTEEDAEALQKVRAEQQADEFAANKKAMLEKLVVPERYASFFSPFEVEDLQDRFLDFDEDLSGTISVAELSKVFAALGEDIEMDVLKKLVEEVDENNSGALEWDEFVGMFADFKVDHSRTAKFSNVLKKLVKTPCVALEQEARKRKLDVFYQLIETREEDSWNPKQYVMEVGVSGSFHEVVGEETITVKESRYFDGIGRTTRAAKFKAATMALINLRENAPGAKYTPGDIPPEWEEWLKNNICAGVPSTKALGKLFNKGFFPYKNHRVMDFVKAFNLLIQLTSTSAQADIPQDDAESVSGHSHSSGATASGNLESGLAAFHANGSQMRFPPNGRYASLEDFPIPFVLWVKKCRAMFIDGPILLDVLERDPFKFPAELNE